MTTKQKIQDHLTALLNIPSPTGYTDDIVAYVKKRLEAVSVPFSTTNRGALIAHLGNAGTPGRAILIHLDTLGAMISQIQADGQLCLTMLGSWSARFAEGARVSLITDDHVYRGTILPKLASGHVYADAVDKQDVSWENLRLRLDERIHSKADVDGLGIRIGDIIAVDSVVEFSANGFINSRHLDNKAAAAVILALLETISITDIQEPCDIIFTVSEEIGTGAQHVISKSVSECLAIDISTADRHQNTCEGGITFAVKDASGPYDRKLTRQLEAICQQHKIPCTRDVFRYYRSDASAAIQAGHDVRCALACFEVDGSHGYERTHMDSLIALTNMLDAYLFSK